MEALLGRVRTPWYLEMLAEAGIGDLEALRRLAAAGGLAEALSEAGVEPHHAAAIAAELLAPPPAQAAAPPPPAAAAAAEATDAAAAAAAGAGAQGGPPHTFTAGGIYCPRFLGAVLPLYDMAMGAENVAPLLYSLLRFLKPSRVLEVGGGFTSIFLLQALEDNALEVGRYREMRAAGSDRVGATPWCVEPFFAGDCDGGLGGAWGGQRDGGPAGSAAAAVEGGELHCIDNMAHEHTTANRVEEAAERLGVRRRLRLHVADAFDEDLPAVLAPGVLFDFIWIDLGAAHRLGRFFDSWWPRLSAAGGMVAVHSTLTNQLTRDWLERTLRRRGGAAGGSAAQEEGDMARGSDLGGCDFETISFLEPHKLFQNSITLLQKRGGGAANASVFSEPVHTRFP